MKIFKISASLALSVLLTTSCNNNNVCECTDLSLKMMKELQHTGMNKQAIEQFQHKYADEYKICDELTENKTEEEIKELESEMKQCDSYKKLVKISKEMQGIDKK